MKLIGLHGDAGAGKDFLGDLLVKHRGFVKMALADKMKLVCADVYGFTKEQLWGPSENRNAPDRRFPRKHGPWVGDIDDRRCSCCNSPIRDMAKAQCYLTPRLALQLLGTEWGRICYENVWVDYVLGTFVSEDKANGVVITDVRYDNEAAAIHKVGGNVYVVERVGAGLAGAAGKHSSERGVSKELIDGVIANAPGTPLETTLALLAEIA